MSHITPGCTALIHGLTCQVERNGTTVRVIALHAPTSDWLGEPWWQIDTTDERDLCSERNLLRIDGHVPTTDELREELSA